MQFYKPHFEYKDDRGAIRGIIKDKNWQEINIITSKKGIERGNHYHEQTIECLFITKGKIKVHVKNLKTHEEKEYVVKENDCFVFEPYELHTLEILEDAEWINMLSVPMNNKNPDIHKK